MFALEAKRESLPNASLNGNIFSREQAGPPGRYPRGERRAGFTREKESFFKTNNARLMFALLTLTKWDISCGNPKLTLIPPDPILWGNISVQFDPTSTTEPGLYLGRCHRIKPGQQTRVSIINVCSQSKRLFSFVRHEAALTASKATAVAYRFHRNSPIRSDAAGFDGRCRSRLASKFQFDRLSP